jgi:N-methylhydantoinase A
VSPFDPARLNANLDRLKSAAHAGMEREGIPLDRRRLQLSLDMRHKGQINEVEVTLPWDEAVEPFQQSLAQEFYARYEQLYGRGASFKGARLEIVTFRVRMMADTPRPRLRSANDASGSAVQQTKTRSRPVYWDELRGTRETPIYDGTRLTSGTRVDGPAIVETPDTSVVVRPGQHLVLDALGNFELNLAQDRPAAARPKARKNEKEVTS